MAVTCLCTLALLSNAFQTTPVPDTTEPTPDPLAQRAFVAELSAHLVTKAAEVRHALIHLAAQAPTAPIGSCLSLVDLVCALYYQYLELDADTPGAPERDRIVFGKAHALLTLQPMLAELGLLPPTAYDTLDPDACLAPGVPILPAGPGLDAAPHAQGLALGLAAGRALAAQLSGHAWRVYCILGDGALADGATWEAAQFAAHYRMGNLVVLLDRNGLTADGPTMHVLDPEPVAAKWFSMGWDVIEIAGNRMDHVVWALETLPSPTAPKPVVLLAATTSGAGVDFMMDRPEWRTAHMDPDTTARAHTSIDAPLEAP